MKRQFPGLHSESRNGDGLLEGVFLVRVDRAFYRQDPQKPFFALRFAILEPKEYLARTISGRLYWDSSFNCDSASNLARIGRAGLTMLFLPVVFPGSGSPRCTQA